MASLRLSQLAPVLKILEPPLDIYLKTVPLFKPSGACTLSVTSLGWVTTGAATGGVTPLFLHEKPGHLFKSPFLSCHPCLFSPEKLTTFFAHHCSLLIDFTRVSPPPPGGCHPAPFLPVRPHFSTILCKFAPQKCFPRVSPPGGCHWGGPPPVPLVTPLYTLRLTCMSELRKGLHMNA